MTIPLYNLSVRRSYTCLFLMKPYHIQERLQKCDHWRTWTHEWRDVMFSGEWRFFLHMADPCLATSWRTHIDDMYSSSSYWPITRSDGVRCHWVHASVLSCSNWCHLEEQPFHFCCLKAHGSTLYSGPPNLRFSRIMHDHMLLVLQRHFLMQKSSAAALASTFLRSVTNRNYTLNDYRWLVRHLNPVTTVDDLWHDVKAEWAAVPVHAIQYLLHSMPTRISVAIDAGEWLFWILISKELVFQSSWKFNHILFPV